MSIPIKVEVFYGEDEEPICTNHYEHFRVVHREPNGFFSRYVETVQKDFGAFAEFPSPERMVEVFIKKGLGTLTKLYLDDNGCILTRIKITVIK